MDANREHWDEATDIHARGNVTASKTQGWAVPAALDRGRGARRRRGQDAPAPAVPLRARHALVGPAGSHRHRRRLLPEGHRARALAGHRGGDRRAVRRVQRLRPAGRALGAIRRRLLLLRRALLASRPEALGGNRRQLPRARRDLLHRRGPPVHPGLPDGRGHHGRLDRRRARTSRTSTTRPGTTWPASADYRRTRRPDTRRPSTRGSTAWAIS